MGQKQYFFCYPTIFLKHKNFVNVNVVNLAQITFPDALNFSVLEKRRCSLSLSHIEAAKLQRRDSVAPSLDGAKKCFLQSVSSTICVLHNIYEHSHA